MQFVQHLGFPVAPTASQAIFTEGAQLTVAVNTPQAVHVLFLSAQRREVMEKKREVEEEGGEGSFGEREGARACARERSFY